MIGAESEFLPQGLFICSADHSAQKKKLGERYEKNIAMQDTTNLEPGGGVWVVLACN